MSYIIFNEIRQYHFFNGIFPAFYSFFVHYDCFIPALPVYFFQI